MITLHHVPQTRSMRVLWLLHELDVPFQVVQRVFDRSLREPEFLSLSPVGRVPALEIEGERMFESGAMMQYLCEKFPERGLGRMPGDMDRMAWLVWLNFAETVSNHVANLTQHHIMLRAPEMRSETVMRLEAARLKKCYGAIEARLSTPVENRDYLLTGGFSACDIAVGQAVYMGLHFATLDGFDETQKWYARITQREAFWASLPSDATVLFYQEPFYPPPEAG